MLVLLVKVALNRMIQWYVVLLERVEKESWEETRGKYLGVIGA